MVSRRIRLLLWWRRAGIGLRLVIFVLSSILLAALVYMQRPVQDSTYQGNNVLVFVLVNLNIALLCVLAFLVGRNIIKLIFDRKNKILGSRLRMRLVFAFVGLTLVPTTIIFILASGLLNTAMQGWFSSQVESSYSSAVKVARAHYASIEDRVKRSSQKLSIDIQSQQLSLNSPQAMKVFLESRRVEDGLYKVQIVKKGEVTPFLVVQNAASTIGGFEEPAPDSDALESAHSGEVRTLLEEQGVGQFIRVYRSLQLQGEAAVLVVSLRVDADLTEAMGVVNDSYKEYQQLRLFKHHLRTGYLLMLAMLTGLILFAAIWFGFYIAREISVPIQRLAEGTREIARGNYQFQIRQSGDDEIGLLVKSFNTMTSDLRNSIQESKEQQLFIQTIMDSLALGVVAFDSDGVVTSINPSARRLLDFHQDEKDSRVSYSELFPPDVEQLIGGLVDELAERAEQGSAGDQRATVESELSFISQGRDVRVLCTAGRIPGTDKTEASTVLLLDDITELSKAQKMSAWREVARRVAHEIKNPLTPIQLSAQRLQRIHRELGAGTDSDELVQVIVDHVASIKRLANEFSNFAMMPTAEFQLSDLNLLVSDTLTPFAENHQDISFHFVADSKLPDVLMDREQIRRILMNLIGNAVRAIEGQEDFEGYAGNSEGSRIVVKTWYDRKKKNGVFEVSDNGPGIPDAEKTRIFQPYYTTSKDGSGLGLAIVTTILADHQGQIRLYDNQPRGAKFIVELPITPRKYTQRRFSDKKSQSA